MCHKLCTESLECTWGKEKDNDIERNKEGRTWRLVRIPRELLIFLLLGPIVMFRLVNVWQELCFYLVLPLFHVLFWVLPVISKRTCRHRQRGTAKICDIYKIFFFVSKNVQEIYVRGAFSLLLPFFFSGSECCACGRCPARRRTAYDGRPVDSAYALAKNTNSRFIPVFFSLLTLSYYTYICFFSLFLSISFTYLRK